MKKRNISWKNGRRPPVWLAALAIVVLSRLLLLALYVYWKQDTGSTDGFFRALYRWDSGWYGSIAENGYMGEAAIHASGEAPWAFFPLVPLLEGAFARLTRLPVRVAGVVLNTVALYFLTFLGGLFCREVDGSEKQALAFMLLLNFGPYNVYYSTVYTECCFALLLCAALYCMYRRHWLLMGVCGALLSATRNTGIFLVLVIPFYCIGQYFQEEESRSLPGFCRWLLGKPRLILGTFMIPMGFFLFMRYLTALLGDGLAFMHVQYVWGREVGRPLAKLAAGLVNIGSMDFYLASCGVLALYLGLRRILRRRPDGLLTLVFLLIPLSTSLVSLSRYVMCSFLVVAEAAAVLSEKGRLAKLVCAGFLLIWGIGTSLAWFQNLVTMI